MNYVSNNLKKYSSVLMIGLCALSAFAQQGENLVPNGSFESTDGKVKKLGGIASATGWTSPTGVRADLFSPSKVPDINIPMNLFGKEDAREGSNYAGFVAFSYGNKQPRSYVMVKLDTPMKKGLRYCVKYYVSLAEASKYASNQIGANFAKKPFATEEKKIINDVAHILHPDNENKNINQLFSWEQICGTYIAEGGEKYLTIGNFAKDIDTHYEPNKKTKDLKVNQVIAAYYYLDEVSVQLLDENEKCDCLLAEEKNEYSTVIYQKAFNLNEKMTPTQKIELQQTFFAFGKTNLSPAGKESLDLISELLKADPTLKLEVQGHSDAAEDKVGAEKPAYAEMASKRTNAVILYLMEKGIDEARMIPSAQGSESPNEEIAESDDEDLKTAKNSRVTFKVR
jgi:outer membrane protein OmpA-like peptidoglycan-associated protein